MSGLVLGVDPGDVESAFTLIEADSQRPVEIGKVPNGDLLMWLTDNARRFDRVGLEMIASYGMPVGKTVFETCVWIGRFEQHLVATSALTWPKAMRIAKVYRRDVKLHHCNSAKAKDPNVTQALIDRFASGAPNRGKGTKAEPGWFHGFADDIWQAYAVAVLIADQETTS